MNVFHRPVLPLLMPLAIMALAAVFLLNRGTAQSGKSEEVSATKKIVLIAGKASHAPGAHEHRAGCMLLADQLNRSGLPVNAVVVTDGWPRDESVLMGAAAVVIYADGGPDHPAIPHLGTLRKLAHAGAGIGLIHYALIVPDGEPGETVTELIGGYYSTDWSVNPIWHANFVNLPDHPVTRGIHDFQIRDEWYYHMRFRQGMEGVTPILSDLPPERTLKSHDGPHTNNPHVRAAVLDRKESQHVMWVYQRPDAHGGGRGFGFTGGHFHRNWQHDDHRGVVLNAIAWIAGIEVPGDGVPGKTPTDEEMAANLDDKGR